MTDPPIMMSCRRSCSSRAALALAVAVAVALTLTLAPSAQGQPPAAEADEPSLSGPARKLFLDGQAARKVRQFQTCYENALGAWKLDQTAGIAALIGDCAFDLEKYRESAERLSWFFDHLPTRPKPALIAYMRERLTACKKQIATVRVTASVPGARILVDGHVIEATEIFLDPGPHAFEAQADGYQTATLSLTLAAGTDRQVPLELLSAAAQRPGGDPNGGALQGHGGVSDGVYWGLGGTGMALSAVGLVVAIGLTAGANGSASDAADLRAALGDQADGCAGATPPGQCSELSNAVSSKDSLHNAAIGAWAGTSVALLTTVALLLWLPRAEDETASGGGSTSAVTVAPLLGFDGGGLWLGVTF